MENNLTPFPSTGYVSKEYFCDREKELGILTKNLNAKRNITLISNRRLGKSALIHRLFDEIENTNTHCIYIDIFSATSLSDITNALATAIYIKYPSKKSIGKLFWDYIKNLRPVISYDVLTNKPELRFEFVRAKDYENTLSGLLKFLDSQNKKIILAIDEFQQIANCEEANIEAILRTMVQALKNINFIFCGSKKHLMLEIFNSAKRPFFASTLIMGITEIDREVYKPFIIKQFRNHKRTIDEESLDFILDWTLVHTYYTQVICRAIFSENIKRIAIDIVKKVCGEQLEILHTNFLQYRNLLPQKQWQVLVAMAKEEFVFEPNSQYFLNKYKLGAAATVKKSLQALIEKELICTIESKNKIAYRVYDVFLLRWIQSNF